MLKWQPTIGGRVTVPDRDAQRLHARNRYVQLLLDALKDTEKNLAMRVKKGKVNNGQINVDGEYFDEGSVVTVLVSEENTFTLTDIEEAALLESIAEADRGELLDATDVLKRLP